MQAAIQATPNLEVIEAAVEDLVVENGRVAAVVTADGRRLRAGAVVLTTGTFLRGLIHVGLARHSAGRAGEFASVDLSSALRDLGLTLGRLKTGTSPRLRASTIDYAGLEAQHGDAEPWPFHWATERLELPQVACHLTYTTPRTHEIVRGVV